ncbi:NACHT domain-containing protein [Amycolatopsis sp. NPDC049868]|uniref:NACHT domain-containing protein n=1 Tax=Amycolatopsis sp. NPDC049868 TaxID=3363934 RepID=UPI0037BB7805
MRGGKRWAVVVVALAAGTTVIALALRSPDGLRSATSIGGLIAALTPLVLGLAVWARRSPPVALTTSTPEQTDAAQRQLASQVLGQWRDEINVRQLDDPGPLAVRWRSTGLDVVDRVEHSTRGALPRGRGRRGFAGRTDRIGEVAAGFRKLDRRRLVILGAPGMGKTTLALLLLRELLEHAEPGDPVPVLLSMSGWDPGAESLSEWLIRRLAEDYPALRATVFGPDAARSLVIQRRVLPVLDGLDELSDEVRPAILARLNETAADPLVLTCRTVEYQSAVAAPGGDALTGGAVIEPAPLTPADAADYLTDCLPPGTAGTWHHLLASLRDGVDSPVTHALSTPLALWLLRKVYLDTRADPAKLCDASAFPDADTVIDHLLDHLVDAVIRANPPLPNDDEHPFRPRRAWDPADATRWLTFLARHLSTIGSRDLAWWQLHRAAPRTVAVMAGLVAGLTVALAVVIHDGLQWSLADALVVGSVLGLVFGLVVGFARRMNVGHVLGLVFGLDMLAIGIGAGLASILVPALVFTVVAAVSIVLVAVLTARAAGPAPADRPAYADLRLRGRTRLLARKLTGWAESGLALRFVPGFGAGFMFGGTLGFVFGGLLGLADAVLNGLASGLLLGMVCGLASWLAIGVIAWAETPITDEQPRTPTVTFGRDLQLVYVKSLAGGAALGVALGVQDALSGGTDMTSRITVGLLVTVTITLGIGLHHPSGRYLITVIALRTRNQIPLRLLAFLNDAHRLGLLRQTGPLYQFRHAKLHDRLATRQDQPARLRLRAKHSPAAGSAHMPRCGQVPVPLSDDLRGRDR